MVKRDITIIKQVLYAMNKNLFLLFCLCLIPLPLLAEESVCYGTTAKGRLEGGVKLPASGDNFISYGSVPALAGRTYVHSKVRKVVLQAYAELHKSMPHKVFKYAETGFEQGGRFKPHKTHQNGLSVDFMVPVIDQQGNSSHFPTNLLNRYGYDVEFNSNGVGEEYTIDFEALAAHIVALHKAALANEIDLWRVLFAPDLQHRLYATKHGQYIKQNIHIPGKRSWVRHDEHYHVDFKVACRPM